MYSQKIVVNDNGVNTYLPIRQLARVWASYDQNTNGTVSTDAWEPFPNPSTAISVHRSHLFEVGDNNNGQTMKFKYVGPSDGTLPGAKKFFHVSGLCNIRRVGGGNSRIDVQYQWTVNGVGVGYVRDLTVNGAESMLLSGDGYLALAQNDVIAPRIWVRSTGDPVRLWNCSIDCVENLDHVFGLL